MKPKARSWGLLFDDRYKGKIAWYDDGSTMFPMTGLYLGFKDPWKQTDAQLKQAQKFLISKKHLVRTIWSSETALWEAFGSGDLWIAYAWPNDWVQMKKKQSPAPVVYMFPKEKPLAWVGMLMLLKGSPRPKLAHAYVDAWSSRASGTWLEDNYGYGHSNLSHGRARATSCGPSRSRIRRRWGHRTHTSTATSRGGISTRSSGKA